MKLHLSAPKSPRLLGNIQITGSKSETNRLLLLQALFPNLSLRNTSNSDDAEVMKKGLAQLVGHVDIHHAGTAMRFLTSYFATKVGADVVLTGSERMQERPIKILVEALLQLGATITYEKQPGYPPLKIKGNVLQGDKVSLPANISSQYISSLCLIAPTLTNGLTINLIGKITSVPYIKMTLALLTEIGVKTSFEGNQIQIFPKGHIAEKTLVVESDWSAASYFYSCTALAEIGSEIILSSYKELSLQGDRVLADLYNALGVSTGFSNDHITLTKIAPAQVDVFEADLSDAPDIAQTIAVTCLGLGIGCHLKGLHTLPIKETDRLQAMKTELEKFGASVTIDSESLSLSPISDLRPAVSVDTYNDHRMAMAFAPLAIKTPFVVNEAEVVSKSYPDFWKDMEKLGFGIKNLS